MKLLLALSFLMVGSLWHGPILAQGTGQAGGLTSRTELDQLVEIYAQTQGGAARLKALHAFRFEITPVLLAPGATPEAAPVEQPQLPLSVEVRFDDDKRSLRIEETNEGRRLVKLSDGRTGRVWIDGTESKDQPTVGAAIFEARNLLLYLDLLYRIDGPELRMQFEGVKQRDGVGMISVRMEFHPDRQAGSQFRNLFHTETNLVERIEMFDSQSLRRTGSIRLSRYADFDGIKVPQRFEFFDRDSRPVLLWNLAGVEVDPTIDPKRFTQL